MDVNYYVKRFECLEKHYINKLLLLLLLIDGLEFFALLLYYCDVFY